MKGKRSPEQWLRGGAWVVLAASAGLALVSCQGGTGPAPVGAAQVQTPAPRTEDPVQAILREERQQRPVPTAGQTLHGAFFYAWGDSAVSLPSLRSARDQMGINTAVIVDEWDNGNAALSVKSAQGLGLYTVVQLTPGCLVEPDKPLPDVNRAAEGIRQLAGLKVQGVILVHESGAEHPQARAYVAPLIALCGQLGVEPVFLNSPELAGQLGASCWQEFYLNLWDAKRNEWQVRTYEQFRSHLQGRLGEMARKPRRPLDAMLCEFGGFRDFEEKRANWSWPTPSAERLTMALRELGPWRDHLVFWLWTADSNFETLSDLPQQATLIRQAWSVPATP